MNTQAAPFTLAASTLALAWLAPSATASAATQWSTDTSVNQVVSDAASDQSQPKVVSAGDGGYWVSWFDGIATGWDVRLQRFDSQGGAAFPAGGILVADRSFSSTQDYGLDVAQNGDALLAFRDDRSGSVEVTAARYSADGTARYGTAGLTLTANAGFVAAPRITSSRTFVFVAWTEGPGVRVRAIDGDGSPTSLDQTWSPSTGSYTVADMHGGLPNTAIFSVVHATGGFSSPRHLLVESVGATGGSPWTTSLTPVFTSGSLQIGALPKFTVNSSGESILVWYSSSPSLQCFAQYVDSFGAVRWQPNGVPVATTPGVRVNPVIAPVDGDRFPVVVWRDQNASQSQAGISAQRFDRSTGQRMWGDAGVNIAPISSQLASSPNVYFDRVAQEFTVTWEESQSFGSDRVFGTVMDLAGSIAVPTFDVASSPSGKSRLTGAQGVAGGVLSAWADNRDDGGDILIQQFAASGAPGEFNAVSIPTLCTGNPNSTGIVSTTFVVGSPSAQANDSTLWTVGLPAGAFGFFITSPMQGFIQNPAGSSGNICLGGGIGRLLNGGGTMVSDPAGTFRFENDLTQHPTPNGVVTIQSGEEWFFQAWHRDSEGGLPTSNFSEACSVVYQ